MFKVENINSDKIPPELKAAAESLEKELDLIKGEGWIAGGALRSRIANDGDSDIDLYFPNEIEWSKTCVSITSDPSLEAKILHQDEKVCLITSKIGEIDLVKIFYKDPMDCLNSFDFTVCCLAVDKNRNVYWHEQALQHIKEKRIVVLSTKPLSGVIRLQKYVKKGYSADLENLYTISKAQLDIWSVDKEYNRLTKRSAQLKMSDMRLKIY